MWYHWITRPQNLLHKVLQCKYKKWCSKTISYLSSVGKKLLSKLWAALNHHNDWKIVAVLSLFCFQVGLRKTNTRAYLNLKRYTKWHQQSYILNTMSTVMQGDTLIGYRSDEVHKNVIPVNYKRTRYPSKSLQLKRNNRFSNIIFPLFLSLKGLLQKLWFQPQMIKWTKIRLR